MVAKIDRTGERNINNFGSEMIIIRHKTNKDIDIYFPQYDWIFKGARYDHFKDGNVKCPYERRHCGIGYIGEGDYKRWENNKNTRVYNTWNSMLQRCYDEKLHEKRPTYKGCNASEEFHNFQNFGEWDSENYYEIEGETMCLDKDILVKGNKIYSPENCIYVPNTINLLFTKRQNDRGSSPIGTRFYNGKYMANCSIFNAESGKLERKYLGCYNTSEEAFNVYKEFKENYIKEVADYYKGKIPQKLYDALINYEVNIND